MSPLTTKNSAEPSFHPFPSLPLELQALILEACPLDDQICLQLTCRTLLTLPISKPCHDDRGKWKCRLGLHQRPEALCGGKCGISADRSAIGLQGCHVLSLRGLKGDVYVDELIKTTPGGLDALSKQCKTRKSKLQMIIWGIHCKCFTPELHTRLKHFILGPDGGKDKKKGVLRYCRDCSKFTWRKKVKGNWRCYHGKPKPKKRSKILWTWKKGSIYAENWWKKGFNSRAMWKMEKRLVRGSLGSMSVDSDTVSEELRKIGLWERERGKKREMFERIYGSLRRKGIQRYGLRDLKPRGVEELNIW